MHVLSHRSTRVTEFMMLVLILVITGCGGDDDNENVTISGEMDLPATATALGGGGGGGVAVASTQFVVVDFEQPNANDPSGTKFQTIGSGTTDPTGKIQITVSQTSSAAVVAGGTQPSGPQQGKIVPVSGLMNLNQDSASKNFDGTTTIACFAGFMAISSGRITAQQLTAQCISNLESASAPFVGTTNYLSQDSNVPNSLVTSANRVLQLTDNCAHP